MLCGRSGPERRDPPCRAGGPPRAGSRPAGLQAHLRVFLRQSRGAARRHPGGEGGGRARAGESPFQIAYGTVFQRRYHRRPRPAGRRGIHPLAHLVRVLRHRAGDEVSVIDGRGTLYHCVLELADAKGAEVRIMRAEPGFGAHPYHLTMAVCPTKNIDRFEWFVEKATEIGVDVIAPVIGERSERRVLKTERLKRIALSAAKQSLKAAVPQIAEPVSVRDFIAAAPADALLKLICYCFDDVPRQLISSVLQPEAERPVMILIGPEGDFSPEEAALARENGWIPVSLGESRLRTETAAVVAATAVYLSYCQ